jgi:large subunit ribosomal protein L30
MVKKTAGTSKRKTTAKKKTTKTTAKKRATKKATKSASEASQASPQGTRLRVRQTRSGIGHPGTYRRTLRALGLKHHQDEVVLPDNPSVRGMVRQVGHLIRVTPEEA